MTDTAEEGVERGEVRKFILALADDIEAGETVPFGDVHKVIRDAVAGRLREALNELEEDDGD